MLKKDIIKKEGDQDRMPWLSFLLMLLFLVIALLPAIFALLLFIKL